MITWKASEETAQTHHSDLLALLVNTSWRDQVQQALGPVAAQLTALASEEGFQGEAGQSFLLHTLGALPAPRVLLLGYGDKKRSHYDTKELGARASQQAVKLRAGSLALSADWASLGQDAPRLIAEGATLGAYRFTRHKSKQDEHAPLSQATLLVGEADLDLSAALTQAEALSSGVSLARDLVNEPPNVCTPAYMAQKAQELADTYDLELTVLDEAQIAEKGMLLHHAVGRGSGPEQASRFIHLTYRGEGEIRKTLAYVGKGVTFDTGGYSIKPSAGMFNMHCDMAGGAAVLGAAEAIARLAPPHVVVHFLVPSAVNMVSGEAYLLNEIITGYGKKTVEINNTDAEGRLLLADALAYAAELGVDEIIDLATLTGACVVALGEHYSALFSNDDQMAQDVLGASREAGERMWHMPLDDRLRDKLKSASADMKNTGDRWGGAITAALFLREWVGDTTWTHLDIAGPSFTEQDAALTPRGGTGVGVATLAFYASRK